MTRRICGAHPRQKTTAMTVWLKYERRPAAARRARTLSVSLAITRRGDPAALYSAWRLRMETNTPTATPRTTG